MSRNIIGLSKLQNRRFIEAHVIYMSSSLVFQSKELQTEPINSNRQHYLNNFKLLFTFFIFIIKIK